jgi:hypothetical protein
MSAYTLAQAQAQLDALLSSQAAGGVLSITIHGRTVTYASMVDMQKAIDYWTRVITGLERKAAGLSRHGYSVADFRGNR